MEHLTIDLLNRYSNGNLAGEELLAADDHLCACEDCRRKLAGQAEPAVAFVQTLLKADNRAHTHLSYDQLQGYVNGKLPPDSVTAVTSHLAACANCRAEVEDLKK